MTLRTQFSMPVTRLLNTDISQKLQACTAQAKKLIHYAGKASFTVKAERGCCRQRRQHPRRTLPVVAPRQALETNESRPSQHAGAGVLGSGDAGSLAAPARGATARPPLSLGVACRGGGR